LWSDVTIQLTYFDRALLRPDLNDSPQTLQAAFDALRVVDIALKHSSREYISEHASEISLILEKPLLSSSQIIQGLVTSILSNILPKDDTETVLKLLLTSLTELLSPSDPQQNSAANQPPPPPPQLPNGTFPPPQQLPPGFLANVNAANNTPASTNHGAWVGIASEAVKVQPNFLDDQMSTIIKALSRMAKEFAESGSGNPTLLVDALKLVTSRVSFLGDQRRPFLTLLSHIGERVQSNQVLTFVLETLKQWVFGSEAFPTVKEKAALLNKLQESFTDSVLASSYFELIVGIFSDPKLRQTELPARLEQPFLVGCMTSQYPEARRQLMKILNDSIDFKVSKRLQVHYCPANTHN